MNFTDELSLNLNDDFFSDNILFQSKENPNLNLSEKVEFLDKTHVEIMDEVAERARKVFDFE